MILKKPYAFLLKYFRVIHLALTLLLIVSAYKLSGLITFFNDYIQSGYYVTTSVDLISYYTPGWLFFTLVLILAISIAVFILMNHKKKPTKLYLFIIIYYLIVFLGLFYISSILGGLENGTVASTLARAVRDIVTIVYLPQFVFIILAVLRTIGFDIKKFDFKSDLKEMNYSSEDAEEFELNINFEGYKAKRKARRALRETIYYIKENRFVFTCFSVVAVILTIFLVVSNIHSNYDVSYGINRQFTYNKLNVTFKDSIVTNLDYNGNVIKNDKYYVVVKTNIINKSGSAIKVDYNNFKLKIGDKYINPSVNYARYFIDYAPDDIPNLYAHLIEKSFALVYEVEKRDVSKSMKIEINNGTVVDKGLEIIKHIYASIKPKKVTDVSMKGNYTLNQVLTFEDTNLGSTTLIVSGYDFNTRYIYKYDSCKNGICSTLSDAITLSLSGNKNLLLIVNVAYNQDTSTLYNKVNTSLSSFVGNFIKIRYRLDGEVYDIDAKNVTPDKTNNLIAFEVPKEVENSDLIQMRIIIRNSEYIVNLKS